MRFSDVRAVGHDDPSASFRIAALSASGARSEWVYVAIAFVTAILFFAGIFVATAMMVGGLDGSKTPGVGRIATTPPFLCEGIAA
jgi:hypothetical protein